DTSGNGNIGTLTNMNTTGNTTSGWTSGKFGKGLQFDGANDYVDAGNAASLNITNAITVSVWTKPITPEGISNYATIASRNNLLFRTREGAVKRFAFFVKIIGVWEPRADWDYADSNIWYHIVGTYDKNAVANNLKLYVNGGLKDVQTRTGVIDSPTANLLIGNVFNGTIDEVRVWSRALAPDETVTMKRII
ncbi:MAG: LamG domain-containing protein, partial [Candidatus Aenigmatarchaeota archaeon]